MAFTLPDLPYDKSALAPYLSAETLEYHHDKHHNAYVTNLNGLLQGRRPQNEQPGRSGEASSWQPTGGLFNNAAQVWNHSVLLEVHEAGRRRRARPVNWPRPSTKPSDRSRTLTKELTQAAVTQFGSGWAWLVMDGGGSQGRQDRERRPAAEARPDRAPHGRRVGARLLHRLPQPARRSTWRPSCSNLVDWDFVAANYARLGR